MAHTFNLREETETGDLCELESSLVYIVSSSITRTMLSFETEGGREEENIVQNMVVHTYNPSTWKTETRRLSSGPA